MRNDPDGDRPGLCYIRIMPERARTKRPRDANQLAKLVVEIATGELDESTLDGKNPAAVALGRLGGKKGGVARAASLTPRQRAEAARHAARTRWARQREGG